MITAHTPQAANITCMHHKGFPPHALCAFPLPLHPTQPPYSQSHITHARQKLDKVSNPLTLHSPLLYGRPFDEWVHCTLASRELAVIQCQAYPVSIIAVLLSAAHTTIELLDRRTNCFLSIFICSWTHFILLSLHRLFHHDISFVILNHLFSVWFWNRENFFGIIILLD